MKENLSIFKKKRVDRRWSIVNSLILFTLFCFNPSLSFAEKLSGQEIVKRADDLLRGDSSWGDYKMSVTTPDWQRTLELKAYSLGRDKTFIRILSPVKEAGITTLRVKNNMWNYLPKVERTIKIPPSMMLQTWMGSDFSNDDLVKESSVVYDYTHKIIKEEILDRNTAYKIELIPKPDAAVTWGKLIFWIRIADFVPLREEFYNEAGKLIKLLEYSRIKQMSDRVIPTIWKMTSITKQNSFTIIEVISVEYNKPIDENTFTLSNLKSN